MGKITVLDKNIALYTQNEEDFICITDIARYRLNEETMVVDSEYKFHIHIIYSVWDNYLVARCLEFNIFQRVDLKEEVSAIQPSSAELAKFLIKKVTKKVYSAITDYLFYLDENKLSDVTNHAPDEYWNAYRSLRKERDNSMLHRCNIFTFFPIFIFHNNFLAFSYIFN